MSDLLRIEELSVDYGQVRVVDRVSLAIQPGEILGLAGESGSGKSTVALAILRLLRPAGAISSGRVLFRGRDILRMDERELRSFRWRQASLVTQGAMNALDPVMTVGDQIGEVLRLRAGLRRPRAQVAELLEQVGLDPARASSYPHQLSGGMRQRAVIAMALALRPPLVIMDEPTTALDVLVQREILAEIARLQRELGLAILLVSHDLSLLLELATQVGVMYAGRLVECAPARELREARHPYTQGLLRSFPDLAGPLVRLEGIPGSPPDPRRPPAGCRFHPRCPQAFTRCRAEAPPLVLVAPGRQSACHLP